MISFYKNNNSKEYYITIEPIDDSYLFEEQMKSLLINYEKQCKEYMLNSSTTIYIKFYLSDPINQSKYVLEYCNDKDYMTFIIGQPPASRYKIAIEAYHIKPDNGTLIKEKGNKTITFRHNNYITHIGELTAENSSHIVNSFEQTIYIFENFQKHLSNNKSTLLDSVQRVWFYIRDIDNNYQGFVNGRNVFFGENGLNDSTHYIASTGIEGTHYITSNLVLMNYKFSENLRPEQFNFMSALNSLCPASRYNVAFERGTKIIFGDCSHYYISGTASIDSEGRILYEKDVLKQIEKVFHNMGDLLVSSKAMLSDLKVIIVYIRDYCDYNVVKRYIDERFKNTLPYLILKAPVCRPGWLIEIEGIAINNECDKSFDEFF